MSAIPLFRREILPLTVFAPVRFRGGDKIKYNNIMGYRFKENEVRVMAENIITHMKHDETKTAWRLRSSLEGLAYCCKTSQKERYNRLRRIALYEALTTNDILKTGIYSIYPENN